MIPYEHEEAVTFFQWCQMKEIECWHLSQEVYTKSMNQKRKQKAEGVRSGVADYLVLIKSHQCKLDRSLLLFVEMKRQKGKGSAPSLSKSQREFLDLMDMVDNVGVKVAYGADEAMKFVEQWLHE